MAIPMSVDGESERWRLMKVLGSGGDWDYVWMPKRRSISRRERLLIKDFCSGVVLTYMAI